MLLDAGRGRYDLGAVAARCGVVWCVCCSACVCCSLWTSSSQRNISLPPAFLLPLPCVLLFPFCFTPRSPFSTLPGVSVVLRQLVRPHSAVLRSVLLCWWSSRARARSQQLSRSCCRCSSLQTQVSVCYFVVILCVVTLLRFFCNSSCTTIHRVQQCPVLTFKPSRESVTAVAHCTCCSVSTLLLPPPPHTHAAHYVVSHPVSPLHTIPSARPTTHCSPVPTHTHAHTHNSLPAPGAAVSC